MINTSELLKAKLLVVDDQAPNILLLERLLRGAGYTCVDSTQHANEVKGLHLINQYDLILLDLNMPEMDGFEVMKQLQSIKSDTYLPVLVITAQPNEKLRALKAGALDFVSKPFDIAEVLARVQNLLQVRLLSVRSSELYAQVLAEQTLSELLLNNVFPKAILNRLKGQSRLTAQHLTQAIADRFDNVSVLFADIVGFTAFSKSVSAEVLVGVLNDLFTRFDHLADLHGLEKIKTIGDCYMAAAGVPTSVSDHADRAAHMALGMINAMALFNEENPHSLSLRIGISSGPAVAGVIGKSKFVYDLWGDVVNNASRMESNGLQGKIHISDETRQALLGTFLFEYRGLTDDKIQSKQDTWILSCA